MQIANIKHSEVIASNIDSPEQHFSIGDVSVVIEILRNRLYAHPIRTLVQEYLCNARDACRELQGHALTADENLDIDVTLPNARSPVFSVRDYGTGISPERMNNVFVQYGSSTKRNSNETGGFGIGAKSAWSYTDSFTITTVHEGMKSVYVAHTGTTNQGSIKLISQEETNDRTGTEIQIAVASKDVTTFVQAVKRATFLWKKQPRITNPDPGGGLSLGAGQPLFSLPEVRIFKLENGNDLGVTKCAYDIDGVLYTNDQSSKDFERTCMPGFLYILSCSPEKMDVSASRESFANTLAGVEAAILADAAITEQLTLGMVDRPWKEAGQAFRQARANGIACKISQTIIASFPVQLFLRNGSFQLNTDKTGVSSVVVSGKAPNKLPSHIKCEYLFRDFLLPMNPVVVFVEKTFDSRTFKNEISGDESKKLRYAGREKQLVVVHLPVFKNNEVVPQADLVKKAKDMADFLGEWTSVEDLPMPPANVRSIVLKSKGKPVTVALDDFIVEQLIYNYNPQRGSRNFEQKQVRIADLKKNAPIVLLSINNKNLAIVLNIFANYEPRMSSVEFVLVSKIDAKRINSELPGRVLSFEQFIANLSLSGVTRETIAETLDEMRHHRSQDTKVILSLLEEMPLKMKNSLLVSEPRLTAFVQLGSRKKLHSEGEHFELLTRASAIAEAFEKFWLLLPEVTGSAHLSYDNRTKEIFADYPLFGAFVGYLLSADAVKQSVCDYIAAESEKLAKCMAGNVKIAS